MNPAVDALIEQAGRWTAEFALLRQMALSSGLDETIKWGQPCYTLNDRNIVLIHGFKDYCALLFFKGALMKDPENLLIIQTENVQASRQIRFTSLDEIASRQEVLKAYFREAVAVEMSGQKVSFKPTADFPVPDELQEQWDAEPAFAEAFRALTPGRQRAYLLHFGEPKQSKTRLARIEKHRERIFAGKGLTD
ncbi:MAG: hypothetical protein HKM05_04170 [Spirochaetales bacterium]|nr:hypothetical protein [Spirochaetales bacterium]